MLFFVNIAGFTMLFRNFLCLNLHKHVTIFLQKTVSNTGGYYDFGYFFGCPAKKAHHTQGYGSIK